MSKTQVTKEVESKSQQLPFTTTCAVSAGVIQEQCHRWAVIIGAALF
jgi:hypothetical protein